MPENVNPLIQSFIDYLKFEKRYSPHTIISYRTDLIDFFNFLDSRFGIQLLNEMSHNQVRTWLAELSEKNIKAKSLNRKISSLRSFFKYHLKMGKIEVSPMTKVISPKMSKRLPDFIKESDIVKLTSTLNSSTEDWKTVNAKIFVTLLYNTGIRLNELITLKQSQVDFSKSQIKVLGKGNKERIIPLNQKTVAMLREYEMLRNKEFENTGMTFFITEKGKKVYSKYAYLLIKKMLDEILTLTKKSPHTLRHTFATHLMNNGADLNAVKELLGHSSLAATQVYLHNTIGKLKDIHKKAHPKA